jgi:ribosomal-protein-alanine N-acetyltransferase
VDAWVLHHHLHERLVDLLCGGRFVMVDEIRTSRLLLLRADRCVDRELEEFFTTNVEHLRPWLPEAALIAANPALVKELKATAEAELAAGREERWFLFLSEVLVGYVFLTRFRRDGHRSCELSYGIGAPQVGRGLMREAVEALLVHAGNTLGFSRIDARYSVDNEPSARLLERLGFEQIGVAPQHAWVNGDWRDHALVTRVQRGGPL